MTLSELRGLLRLTLAGTAAWPDGTLDRWIGAGIRLYSAHFPRRVRATLDLAAGTQTYALPGATSLAGVISVEYPAGLAPARFLRCTFEWAPGFAAGGPYYAVQGVALDGAAGDEASASANIVFAETIRDGETAVVEAWAPHAVPEPGDDTAALTVPDQHMESLSAYVEFAAHYELETDEACVTDGSTIVLAQLGEESRRAWNRYKEVMDRLTWLGATNTSPCQPVWAGYGL